MRDLLRRNGAALAALAMMAGGVWLLGGAALTGAPGPLLALGLITLVATALARDAMLRARLAAAEDAGPGLVAVREGAIAYFGPSGGGMADLDALSVVAVGHGPAGRMWLLSGVDGQVLRVPAGAVGAEALLDALYALPGFSQARLGRALTSETTMEVWRRAEPAPRLPAGPPPHT